MRILFTCLIILISATQAAWAQCANPAGVTADVIHNSTHNIPQYCDGTSWIAMAGPERYCPEGISSCGGRSYERLVFTGNGGRGDASVTDVDTSCNDVAVVNGIHGIYYGWYATNADNDPESRYEKSTVPYVMTNGVIVADNWTDLTDGTLDININRRADGSDDNFINSTWTNVLADGTHSGSCTVGTATRGRVWDSNSGWTEGYDLGVSCGVGGTYYCFEQKDERTQIVPSGLVGHWRLDETSGTTAFDSSGNGNDGTMNGGLTAANSEVGIVNQAIRFNGSSNEITLPLINELNSADALSVCSWFQLNSTPINSRQVILSAGSSINLNSRFWLTLDPSGANGEVRAFFQNSVDPVSTAQYQTAFATSYDNLNGWRHACFTLNLDTSYALEIYFEGQPVAILPGVLASQTDNMDQFNIGRRIFAGPNYFDGHLDDIRVYNRALTAAEVQEIYEARDGIHYNEAHRVPEFFDGNKFVPMRAEFPDVTDGLVGHWKLDETTGVSLVDSSGTHADGTFYPDDISTQTTRGAIGRSLAFNGTTNYAELANAPAVCNVFDGGGTLSFWTRPETDDNYIFMRNGFTLRTRTGVSGETGIWFTKGFSSGTGQWRTADTTPDISIGEWNHIVIVYDQSSDANDPTFYINGSLATIPEFEAPVGTASGCNSSFELGYGFSTSITMQGDFDDVRLYDRMLSNAEVQHLYKMGTPVGSSTALPQGCPNIGDICDDGTIYAGLSPDGNVEMFFSRLSIKSNVPWSNGNLNGYTSTSATSNVTGEANTARIVIVDANSNIAGFQKHLAAQHCHDFSSHSTPDWYLPARNEIDAIATNFNGFDLNEKLEMFGNGLYWSSTEVSTNLAYRTALYTNTFSGDQLKGSIENVICVRKGPAPRCANPYGVEGAMIYNTTHDVTQYCDGARWVAVGKRAP